MLVKLICCITDIYLDLTVRYPDNIEFAKWSPLMRAMQTSYNQCNHFQMTLD